MDSDPEVNAALDILAEFCTQKLKDGKLIKMKSVRTSSVYSIDMEAIEQLHRDLGDLFNLTNEKKQLSLF